MTDAECAETLAEFRKLTLGPELSAALDHAIGRMTELDMRWANIDPTHPAYPMGPKHQAPGIGWPVQCSATS